MHWNHSLWNQYYSQEVQFKKQNYLIHWKWFLYEKKVIKICDFRAFCFFHTYFPLVSCNTWKFYLTLWSVASGICHLAAWGKDWNYWFRRWTSYSNKAMHQFIQKYAKQARRRSRDSSFQAHILKCCISSGNGVQKLKDRFWSGYDGYVICWNNISTDNCIILGIFIQLFPSVKLKIYGWFQKITSFNLLKHLS